MMFSENHFKIEEYIDRAKKSGGINARNKKAGNMFVWRPSPFRGTLFNIVFDT